MTIDSDDLVSNENLEDSIIFIVRRQNVPRNVSARGQDVPLSLGIGNWIPAVVAVSIVAVVLVIAVIA